MHYPYIYRLQRYKKKLNYERNSTLNMLKSISAFNFHPFIIIFSTALLSLLSLFFIPTTLFLSTLLETSPFKNEDQYSEYTNTQ